MSFSYEFVRNIVTEIDRHRHPFNGLNEARHDEVAVASAGPHANRLHFASDR